MSKKPVKKFRTVQSSQSPKKITFYALYNRSHPDRFVATRDGDQCDDGWFHPHSVGHRDRHGTRQSHFQAKESLIFKKYISNVKI